MKTIAIILAGGSGVRFNSKLPKQFHVVKEKTILEYTLDAFMRHSGICSIIVTLPAIYLKNGYSEKLMNKYNKLQHCVLGGSTRLSSASNALNVLDETEANILVHDGTRPFVSEGTISRCIKALDKYNAVYPALPLVDSIIRIENKTVTIPNRDLYLKGQTPQGFSLPLLRQAHALALEHPVLLAEIKNDCGLINHFGLADIAIVDGNHNNIKITYPEDMLLFDLLVE